MTEKKSKAATESQPDPYSFLDRYIDKSCNVKLTSGSTVVGTIKEIRPYEILIEVGMRTGKPIEKVMFKHGIAMVEERM